MAFDLSFASIVFGDIAVDDVAQIGSSLLLNEQAGSEGSLWSRPDQPPEFDTIVAGNGFDFGGQRGIEDKRESIWPSWSDLAPSSSLSFPHLPSPRYRYRAMSFTYTGDDRCTKCVRENVTPCTVPETGRQVRCDNCMNSPANARCTKASECPFLPWLSIVADDDRLRASRCAAAEEGGEGEGEEVGCEVVVDDRKFDAEEEGEEGG